MNSEQSFGESLARAIGDANYAAQNAARPSAGVRHGSSASGGAGVLALFFFAIGLFVIFFYIVPEINARYSGQGAMIGMVNPSGDNPGVDRAYSEINQTNATANTINAAASFVNVFTLLFFVAGVVILFVLVKILQSAGRA